MPPPNIPLLYRFTFLYFEPLGALLGAYINLLHPSLYLTSLSPQITISTYTPLTQPIYDQLAGHLLLFAWIEAILLRYTTDNIKLWKLVFVGILLCDGLHLWGQWKALGTEMFWDARLWRWQDWINFVTLWGQAGLRVAFLLGVGLEKGREKRV